MARIAGGGGVKYRKRPIIVEAFQYLPDSENNFACPDWFKMDGISYPPDEIYIEIQTLEGLMIARPRDWVIRGIKGEEYPCKPDIFEATYEPV